MTNPFSEAIVAGFVSVANYLQAHVLFCLVPAFFIAGAISTFVRKEAVLRYFGAGVPKYKSYPLASVSGVILAVCSCTILPLFAGIHRRGGGIGPAAAFLYAGPAINLLAIVYTARVLGYDLGLARAVAAVVLSVLVGLSMAALFGRRGRTVEPTAGPMVSPTGGATRPGWATALFFLLLLAILLAGTAKVRLELKLGLIALLIIALGVILIRYFGKNEARDWMGETWFLTRKIFPLLLAGTFVVGMLSAFLAPETFRPYLSGNALWSNFLGSIVGAFLYMPTLLEVPVIGTTFGYSEGVMGPGPALALLLAGPAVSLPSMIALSRIIGVKRTATYIGIVVVLSTLAGFIYGWIAGI